MTQDRPGPMQSVPTLTEEVALPEPAREPEPVSPARPQPLAERAVELPSEGELVRQVMAALQRQVDELLEYRVREVLTPILTRATDAVVREARNDLARSLRDLVAHSVAQELQRQRSR